MAVLFSLCFFGFIGILEAQKITVIVGLMLPDQAPAFKQQIGYPTSAAACTIALDRVKKEHLLDQVDWQFVWYHPQCEESLASGIAIDLIVKDKIDLIIGPPCSIAAVVAAIMGKYYRFPLVSWAATADDLDSRFRFPTFTRTVPSSLKLGEAIVEVLMGFGWTQIALVYNDDHFQKKCFDFHLGLEHAMEDNGKTHMKTHLLIDGNTPTDLQMDTFLGLLPDLARIVVVCLDKVEERRRFMMYAHDKGYGNGDYVFIFPDYLPDRGFEKPWIDHRNIKDGRDADAKHAFTNGLIIELDPGDEEEVDAFKKEIPKRMKEWPWFLKTNKADEQYGSTWSPYMHDAMYLYARALNKTLEQGKTKADGQTISENAMDVVFDGISGKVVLNKQGSREATFVVKGIIPGGKYEKLGTISLFKARDKFDLMFPVEQIFSAQGGKIPLDEPVCGFDGLNCVEEVNYQLIIGSVCGGFLGFLLISGLIFFGISEWEKEKMGQRMWKAPFPELIKIDDAISKSSMSLDSVATSATKVGFKSKIGHYDVYYYRGAPVFLVKHNCTITIKHNPDHIEWRAMCLLTHDNVNPFRGLCIDGPQLMSLWKYCPKGSLQDLFENDKLNLDWFFKFSLIREVGEGIEYLHKSTIGSHGLLTSDNCLMDDRWQVKISDFGLCSIRKAEKLKAKQLLWSAPELLRDEKSPPLGTKEGDIYSYGIIMSEILTRSKAWSGTENSPSPDGQFPSVVNEKVIPGLARQPSESERAPKILGTLDLLRRHVGLSPDEIIYRVRKGEMPPFRPQVVLPEDTDVNPAVIHLMKDCLEEKPENRPDMRVIRSQLKGIMKEGTNLMDHVLNMMEKYAESLEGKVNERTKELQEEKKKADILLYRMLPRVVADQLKAGKTILPETFEAATVFFSDVYGFAEFSRKSAALEVVSLLNELYNLLDSVVESHDAYKVETINDAYLVVSGIPNKNGDNHAKEMAELGLNFIRAIKTVKVPGKPKEKLNVRVGLNTGSVVTGVVGLTMPRFCLFGDTVNTASRMESHGKPGKIHATAETNRYLTSVIGGYKTVCCGENVIKGKGLMTTYYVLGKTSDFMSTSSSIDEPVSELIPIDNSD